MKTIVEIFDTLRTTASSKERLEFLKANMNDVVKDIFFRTYNDDMYNIKTLEVQPHEHEDRHLDDMRDWQSFASMLRDLRDRRVTGTEARNAVNTMLSQYAKSEQEILIGVIQKDLKVGVSRDSFQKICPVFNVWEVSLAENLADVKGVDPCDGTYFASRKLDGCRCVCLVEVDEHGAPQNPLFISRQNKVFTTLGNLNEAVKHFMRGTMPGRWVLDGEVCILDDNGDEHFDWIMKEIRRKDHTIEKPCYNVFDIINEDIFYGREKGVPFGLRVKVLEYMDEENYMHDRIRVLKQERINSQEDFDRWSQYVIDGGWEGFMLRKDVLYKQGRSKDLLKVKKFQDAEYKVVDAEEGYMKFGTETLYVVRNLHVIHKGNIVKVGSGISKEQRLAWVGHHEQIVGKTITVQYFEETKDSHTGEYSLRFPILKYVYEGERDV